MILRNTPDKHSCLLDLQIVTSEDGARALFIHYVDALTVSSPGDREAFASLSRHSGLRLAVVRTPASPTPDDRREIQIWTRGSGSAFTWMSLDEFSRSVDSFLSGGCD